MPSGDGRISTAPEPKEYYGERSAMVEDHATRLRSLESGFSDLNAQFAANTVQLEGLNEGVARLTDQISEVHKVVTAAIPGLAQEVATLKSVEAARVARRDKRRSFIGGWAKGALIAASAATVTKFLPFAWTHWLR
jgi:hypothetical protein